MVGKRFSKTYPGPICSDNFLKYHPKRLSDESEDRHARRLRLGRKSKYMLAKLQTPMAPAAEEAKTLPEASLDK